MIDIILPVGRYLAGDAAMLGTVDEMLRQGQFTTTLLNLKCRGQQAPFIIH
jgi:hypothetical protein